MVDDDVVASELLLSGPIDHLEKGIEVLSHSGISLTHLSDDILVNARGVGRHRRSLQALSLELEIELLKVRSELFLFLGHLAICRVVVINAQINELLLHLINDLPACGIKLLLKVLVVLGCLGFLSRRESIVHVSFLSGHWVQQFRLVVLDTVWVLGLLATLTPTPVLNRSSEPSSWLLNNGLAIHVGNQVLEGCLRLLILRLRLEVDWHQGARLDQRVCQEHLQEVLQLLAALLQKGSL